MIFTQIVEAIQAFFDDFIGLFQDHRAAATPAAGQVIGRVQVREAIYRHIVVPLGLPNAAADILTRQSAIETDNWRAWYFQGWQKDGKAPTYNLFNRHAGSGRGEWTHLFKYVGPGDQDIRIYTDIEQSARDYVQWLLHGPVGSLDALEQLRQADGAGYFAALDTLGFDAHSGNYAIVAERYRAGVYV